MKAKKSPTHLKSGDYLHQAMMKGLNKKQKQFAKNRVEFFEVLGVAVPYGLIRKEALSK